MTFERELRLTSDDCTILARDSDAKVGVVLPPLVADKHAWLLYIEVREDFYGMPPDSMELVLDREKATQLRDFLSYWIEALG